MLEISAAFGKVGAILATLIYALTLMGHVDHVVISHLSETFASKADVQMVKDEVSSMNRKLDTVLTTVIENGRK